MNLIGKPEVSQREGSAPAVNPCDLYQIQARRVGRTDDAAWFDMEEIAPIPAGHAARAVLELNAAVPAFVYRSVLCKSDSLQSGGDEDSAGRVAKDIKMFCAGVGADRMVTLTFRAGGAGRVLPLRRYFRRSSFLLSLSFSAARLPIFVAM
jgi:hypothetical protein